jgi:CrcB protein
MLGTLARAAVATWIPGELGTLAVNTSGAFALGLLWQSLAERWRPALITGFLGAFTTFSTLAADLATKPLAQLAGDGALSLLLGLAAAGLGLQIERRLRARP